MSDILDDKDSYIVDISVDEENNTEIQCISKKNGDIKLAKLIDSMTHYLVNENTDTPEKYLLFIRTPAHENYFYSLIVDNLCELNKEIEENVKPDNLKIVSFLLLIINMNILDRDSSYKIIKRMFEQNFTNGLSINDLAYLDITTKILTRGYAIAPWTEYLQG